MGLEGQIRESEVESRIKVRIGGGGEWTLSWGGKGIREEVKGQDGLEPEVISGVTEERPRGQEGVGVPNRGHGASSHVGMNAEY